MRSLRVILPQMITSAFRLRAYLILINLNMTLDLGRDIDISFNMNLNISAYEINTQLMWFTLFYWNRQIETRELL